MSFFSQVYSDEGTGHWFVPYSKRIQCDHHYEHQMSQDIQIQLFENAKVRYLWDEEKQQYFFSVVDVIQVLTDSSNPQTYWRVLKKRLSDEGNETVTNCNALKMPAPDGKMRLTDVATTEQLFRLIQSVPSKKAEPFKLWLAEVGRQRLEQLQDPELSIEQAIRDYRRLGYSESWINQRIMTNVELMLNGLAEAAATELSQRENPQGFQANAQVAQRGGNVAHVAREQLEHELGRTVISDKRAVHFTTPPDELPLGNIED